MPSAASPIASSRQIDWAGSGGAGGNLPDGTFGNDRDITVQEIQAVNR